MSENIKDKSIENWKKTEENSNNNDNQNLNWKYLVSFNNDKTVVIKKNFNVPYKEDWLKTAKNMLFFNPEKDLKYIPEKKKILFSPYETNFDKLKFLKKSYLWKNFEHEDSFQQKKDWFLITLLNKTFSWTKIHNKWEVSMYEDNKWTHIYEVNSTERVEEFGDNFLLFKEYVMFSNSFLIKENMLSMFSVFTEKNIWFLEWMFITWEQWISWEEKSSQFESERFWNNKMKENPSLYEWTMVFWNNILNLENGYFYWINKDMYLYYFIDDKSGKWKVLIKPMIIENEKWEYEFTYEILNDEFYMYSEIMSKIKWLKYYKDKQWNNYLFGMEYYQFNWLPFESYRSVPLSQYNTNNELNSDEFDIDSNNSKNSDEFDIDFDDDLDLDNI